MKIAFFVIALTRRNPAGSTFIDTIESLVSKGIDVTVYSNKLDNDLRGKIHHVSIPIIKFLGIPGSLVSFQIMHTVMYLWRRLYYKERFDVIHTIDSESFLANIVTFHVCSAEFLSVIRREKLWIDGFSPTVVIANISLFLNLSIRKLFEAVNCKRCKCVFALTEWHKGSLAKYYHVSTSKIHLFPNCIRTAYRNQILASDKEKIRKEIRREWNVQEDDFLVVFVAHGGWKRKGLGLLLNTVSLVPKEIPIKVFIVGAGGFSEQRFYSAMAQGFGITERTIWVGYEGNVIPYYLAADCFVLPSWYETFSLVSLEALCSGLPMLMPHISGAAEVIEEGHNGFFIEHTSHSILEKILYLYQHPDRREEFCRRSIERSDRYNFSDQVEKLIAQYLEISKAS